MRRITGCLFALLAASAAQAQDLDDVVIPEPPADPVPPELPALPDVPDLEASRAEHEDEVQFCITRERSLRPDAVGVVEIALTIDATGRATTSVAASSFGEPDTVVAECLAAAMRRWTFPVPSDPPADARLRIVLPPVPALLVEPAVELRVEWWLSAPSGADTPAGIVGDEVREELERLRPRITACITDSDEALATSGSLTFYLRIPAGGDVGRDDLTWVRGTFDDRHALVRCFRTVLSTIEARSSMRFRRYPLAIRWGTSR